MPCQVEAATVVSRNATRQCRCFVTMEKLLESINRLAVSGTPRLVSSHGRKYMLGRKVKRALIGRGRFRAPSCHVGFALFATLVER